MDLPHELYKEIIDYCDYKTLRLINKLFLKISNQLEEDNGIIIPVTVNVIINFINTKPDKISWMVINAKFNKCARNSYFRLKNDLYQRHTTSLTSKFIDSHQTPINKLIETIIENNNSFPTIGPDYSMFPLKDFLKYCISNHYLSNNIIFVEKSLIKTK